MPPPRNGSVALSLYQRAVGYDYTETRVRHGPDAQQPVTETTTRHMPAHVPAAFRWPAMHEGGEWREGADRQDAHHDLADRLRQLGVEHVHEVWFGGKGGQAVWAGDLNVRTANKCAQMWANMRAWLPGGAIPDDDALAADLTGVECGYATDRAAILLEKKEHMRARAGLAR